MNITVGGENAIPDCAITEPADGASVAEGRSVLLVTVALTLHARLQHVSCTNDA